MSLDTGPLRDLFVSFQQLDDITRITPTQFENWCDLYEGDKLVANDGQEACALGANTVTQGTNPAIIKTDFKIEDANAIPECALVIQNSLAGIRRISGYSKGSKFWIEGDNDNVALQYACHQEVRDAGKFVVTTLRLTNGSPGDVTWHFAQYIQFATES